MSRPTRGSGRAVAARPALHQRMHSVPRAEMVAAASVARALRRRRVRLTATASRLRTPRTFQTSRIMTTCQPAGVSTDQSSDSMAVRIIIIESRGGASKYCVPRYRLNHSWRLNACLLACYTGPVPPPPRPMSQTAPSPYAHTRGRASRYASTLEVGNAALWGGEARLTLAGG